jgi:hypothetical protein
MSLSDYGRKQAIAWVIRALGLQKGLQLFGWPSLRKGPFVKRRFIHLAA